MKSSLAGGLGLAAALAGDRLMRERLPRYRFAAAAIGLPVAAVIYPLARSERGASAEILREGVALVGFSALSAAAARSNAARGARLLAAGWVGHAVFDAVHDGGEHSRIPDWYPGLCAGYDVGVAVRLLTA